MKKTNIFILSLMLSVLAFGQYLPHNDGSANGEKRGDQYYEEMAYKRALAEYESALEKSPRDKGLQLKIAKCYSKLNNPEEVTYYASQSVSHSSASADDVLAYAESLASTENYEKAERIYTRYGSMKSDDSRVERKKEGLDKIENLYNDSLGYKVNAAGFNTERSEFGTSFIKDELFFVSNRGKTRWFSKIDMRDESLFLDAYKLSGDMAIEVEDISENLHEGPMSDMGNDMIIVTTNYPDNGKYKNRDKTSKLRLVVYKKGAEGWEMGDPFPHNSKEYSVGHPSFDQENSILYFASNMPGGKGGVDIYKVSYFDGEWGSPENISVINTEGDEMFPFVVGNDMYFASSGRGGLGGLDIYTTKISGGPIYTMGYPVNTPKDDFGMTLRKDGRTGYFSSNRDEGVGMDDIYEVVIYKLRVEASAVDEGTGKPVTGTWKIVDTETGDVVDYSKSGDKAVFDALRGRSYTITTDDEDYAESSGQFEVKTKSDKMTVRVPLKKTKIPVEIEGAEGSEYIVVHNLMAPMTYKLEPNQLLLVNEKDLTPEDKRVVVEDVYFKFDSDEISSGVSEIDKVISIMKAYSDVDVALTAYCDVRGSSRYNEKLAERRAQRVEDYMKKNGIAADRIQSVNVGESKVYVDCSDCNEEQHQKNRRVEFTLKVN